MPPKKDDKKKAGAGDVDPVHQELRNLERAKNDMQVEQAFVMDKFRQMRSENDRLKDELNAFDKRLGNATKDFKDIWEHRKEQIKAEEVKLLSMQQYIEHLDAEIARYMEEIRKLQADNKVKEKKLDDASELLKDREALEEAVRKRHDLIEKQSEELRALRKQLEERDASLEKASATIEELTLTASGTTEMRILFDEPWLVQVSHARLKGEVPRDRDHNTLAALCGGKLLVLYAGARHGNNPAPSSNDFISSDVSVLNTDTAMWERPTAARTAYPSHGHSCAVVGRTKMLTFGGTKGDAPTADVAMFNTDTMKWMVPQVKGTDVPTARTGQAVTSIREKMFVFGGVSAGGGLTNELWTFDLDTVKWMYLTTFGNKPSPRYGASISATEDGRRLYVFGGNDGMHQLNDVHFLELEKLQWSLLPVHVGAQPLPREGHVSCIMSKYMLISGGCTDGGAKRLADVQVLDLYSPRWECLDEGAYAHSMSWLRSQAVYTTFYGNKLLALKPSTTEKLFELQTLEFALPEDIERLRAKKKHNLGLSEKLELMDDAVCSVNSIEVSWRPPTKNVERIDRYKLIIATGTDVVKDVYQGPETRFRIVGLKPNTEYILCIKCMYDDGSHLWSESKAYMTRT